jgi:adenosylcobyric acid synthase
VRGFVINKLRGDPALLLDGCAQLLHRTGIPTFGVLPWIGDVGIDAEDSMALRDGAPDAGRATGAELDVAIVQFPRISNFTDFDPLACEPGVHVRFVTHATALGRPDLVVLPGTKATVADLAWLRERAFDDALRRTDATVLGICGGYQMLGRSIDDGVESNAGRVDGLDLLPVTTEFGAEKVVERRTGTSLGQVVDGYRIHHGRVRADAGEPFVDLDAPSQAGDAGSQVDGVHVDAVYGTTLHGLFEADGFRGAFLHRVAARSNKQFAPGLTSFAAVREARIDRLADLLEAHLDLDAVVDLIASAEPTHHEPTHHEPARQKGAST